MKSELFAQDNLEIADGQRTDRVAGGQGEGRRARRRTRGRFRFGEQAVPADEDADGKEQGERNGDRERGAMRHGNLPGGERHAGPHVRQVRPALQPIWARWSRFEI